MAFFVGSLARPVVSYTINTLRKIVPPFFALALLVSGAGTPALTRFFQPLTVLIWRCLPVTLWKKKPEIRDALVSESKIDPE